VLRTALIVAASVLALPSQALAQSDFTWTGGAPPGTPAWSNSGNWAGSTAPNGAVGRLTFPLLTTPACTASPPSATCRTSNNDITGLTVNGLSIDNGGPVNSSYQITGNPITLGTGGISASTNATSLGNAALRLPITLAGSQTWSIDGNGNGSQLGLYGNVTGSSADSLSITLSRQTFLGLNGIDVEVGPVSITGANTAASGNASFRNGSVTVGNPSAGAQLNATSGNPVTLRNAGITSENSTLGSLSAAGANIQVGEPGPTPPGKLGINGALTLDGATAVSMFFNGSGTTAGTDYSQIAATGAINLGGAHLDVSGDAGGGNCPALHQGDVDTLVTSGATLTGAFAGIPNGTTIPLGCSSGSRPGLKIEYTPNAVEATVVPGTTPPPPPPVEGKTATVTPEKGRVLIKLPAGSHPRAYGLSAAAASGFVPLTAGATIPVGSTLDTSQGQVRLSTATNHSGGTQTGHFSRGQFTFAQGRKRSLTTLSMTGAGLNRCSTTLPRGGAPKQATAARKRRRTLFSNVHGHFRSRGRNSEATVRGTKWSMTDTCAGTLTTVTRGSVLVRDFGLKKNKIVKAGHKYFARAGKRRKR
jgi:hypothetical protein